MADTIDWNKRFDNIRLAKLEYEEVTLKDIFDDIGYSEEDRDLGEDIIKNLEKVVADEILKGKCVQVPYIGCLRKNPLKETLEKNRTNFKIAAKSLSKEGFKEHCALVFKKRKDELRREDYKKAKLKEIRNRHKKDYEFYCTNIGKGYADMFLLSRLNFKAVDYDEEWEELYQKLNTNE